MPTLYDVYTTNIALLKKANNLRTGEEFETLLKALFIQYVDRKEAFYEFAQNKYNLALYPESLENDNQLLAMRLVSWAISTGRVSGLLDILPRNGNKLRREIAGKDDSWIFGILFYDLSGNFPYYGNDLFQITKQRFEKKFEIHSDEVFTRFKWQVFDTIEKAEKLGLTKELIRLAFKNHESRSNRR